MKRSLKKKRKKSLVFLGGAIIKSVYRRRGLGHGFHKSTHGGAVHVVEPKIARRHD